MAKRLLIGLFWKIGFIGKQTLVKSVNFSIDKTVKLGINIDFAMTFFLYKKVKLSKEAKEINVSLSNSEHKFFVSES